MARITIPLDASGIEGLDPKNPVKVLLASGDKPVASEVVNLGKDGQATVTLSEGEARGARIVVGPADATDEELLGLQTLSVDIPGRRWGGKQELTIPAIRITPYYWFWWLRWCRKFTIRGRVLCPDGSAVPGAVVCAYDVDAWWWWWAKQQVGCATTDASGSFSLTFRWCCGWWPWWWWRLRRWQVEPTLAKEIRTALAREPRLTKIPMPEPQPDLALFERFIGAQQTSRMTQLNPQPLPPLAAGRASGRVAAAVDPARLDRLREQLVTQLPDIPALASLRLWPWWPWQPWWDCTPDIVFRATQACHGEEHVIINEGWFQARWNIPQVLDVTLTANDEACCAGRHDCVEGECLALAKVCSIDSDEVGGNPGAAPTPVGYAYPNVISNGGDAPFAGVVDIRGTMQCLSGIDYYEIEYSDDDGNTWQLVPVDGLGSFYREYWESGQTGTLPALFSAQVPLDGRHVYETVEHYEATHDPLAWGNTKIWMATNFDMVFPWVTQPSFGDGTYSFRVVGYDEAGGSLSNPRVINVCDTDTEARVTVTIDNQSTYPAPGPSDNPCGANTTHLCTDEPMTDIIAARIVHAGGGSVPIGPCGNVNIAAGDMLEVDFIAYDSQRHLAAYSLLATYGENYASDLLALGGTLTPLPGATVPAAAQVGSDYATARAVQGAVAPTWQGGAIRLSVLASAAFPESCCYQLELRAWKRTIVNCQANNSHWNLSERSFQVTV